MVVLAAETLKIQQTPKLKRKWYFINLALEPKRPHNGRFSGGATGPGRKSSYFFIFLFRKF